jgi:tRNA-specific adenosine deaminase 3
MDHDEPPLFIEIRPSFGVPRRPDRIEVWTSTVEPQDCGPLLKDLSKMAKDETLSHLKRVKRQKQQTTTTSSPPKKKAKLDLEVLMGRNENDAAALVKTYNLELKRKLVPGRPAESNQELTEFNAIWPTIYFQKNTEEHKEQGLALSEVEIKQMVRGMEIAAKDGAVIMDPESGSVVATSKDELILQPLSSKNPLCTPVILAIQGISRFERKAALGHGMESDTFRNGQYLCTGYDIYVRNEPSVFEAMAMVHSRIRRVVFRDINPNDGGLGGTGTASAVHCLPTTNHRYRVFLHALKSDNNNFANKTNTSNRIEG